MQQFKATDDKKFIETAKNIIKRNPEMLDALMEFERTKKLPKLSKKKRVNFTIDADLMRKFQAYTTKHHQVMSKLVEKKIAEILMGK